MIMGDGWIKMFRRFLEWEWYDQTPMVRLFLHLLLKANYEDKKWHGVVIQRGQLVTSIANLAAETGLSTQVVRSCLDKLQSTGEVNKQSTSQYTIITVCKYANYQHNEDGEQQTNNKRITNQQQTNNKRLTNDQQQHKNIRNKENNNISLVNACVREENVWFEELLSNTAQIEVFCMQEHITPQEFKNYAFAVMNEWQMTGKTHIDRSDMKSHLLATIRKKIQDRRNNGTNRKTYNEQRRDELNKLATGVAATVARRLAEDDARAQGIRQPDAVPF